MISSRAIKEFSFTTALCEVAAAVLGAGALSAGASMWGAGKAADAQTAAADKSIANQQAMYESNKNILAPFINAGGNAIGGLQNWLNPESGSGPLNALMKLIMPGADQSATLEQTPGYQFTQGQGLRAANNALAARGLGGSGGAVAKGAANFASGLASNTWQSVVNNLQNLFTSGGNSLQNLVNTGASSGNALAGVGSGTANQISSSLIGSGNAQAAGWNAIGSAGGNLGNSLTSAAMLQQLTGGGGGGGGLYGSGTPMGWTTGAAGGMTYPSFGMG